MWKTTITATKTKNSNNNNNNNNNRWIACFEDSADVSTRRLKYYIKTNWDRLITTARNPADQQNSKDYETEMGRKAIVWIISNDKREKFHTRFGHGYERETLRERLSSDSFLKQRHKDKIH